MKFAAILMSLCVMASTVTAQADTIGGNSPGYANITYQVGESLPSTTSGRGIKKDFNQELKFIFDVPVTGTVPDSFHSWTSKVINQFEFIAPMNTVFHFVGTNEISGCAAGAKGQVQFYSASNGAHRKVLSPGEFLQISKDEKVSITFNLSDWSGCAFSDLTFEYYLTGEFTYDKAMAQPYRVVEVYRPDVTDFISEISVGKIYQPMFKYSAESVSAPLLEAKLPNCTFNNFAQDIYDGNPMSTLQNIRAKCALPDQSKVDEISHFFENINLLTITFSDVVAQYQRVPAKQNGKADWYIDRALPGYHYRSVVMTTLVGPYSH